MKKVGVLLLRAGGRDDGFKAIPWGILDIASYLKKYGYEAKVLDRKDKYVSGPNIERYLIENKISYVGISAATSQAKDAEFLSRYLKK